MAEAKGHAVLLDSTTLGKIVNLGVSSGNSFSQDYSDGAVTPNSHHRDRIMPMVDFSTKSLKVLLDATGMTGAEISNFRAFSKIVDLQGGAISGSSHNRYTLAKAFLLPGEISATSNQPATMTCQAMGFATDGSGGLTEEASQALPSLAAYDYGDEWTLGPLIINGTAVRVGSARLSFGVTLEELGGPGGSDGVVGATGFVIQQVRPEITAQITHIDDLLAAVGGDLHQVIASSTIFQLRKYDSTTNVRVGNATAEHISFTIAAGDIDVSGVSGSGRQTGTIRILPVDNQSDDLIVVDTTSALTVS